MKIGGGSRERPSGQAFPDQRSRLSDESAAINAGAIARRTNDGQGADHERERQPDGEPPRVRLVEAPACRSHVDGERLQHRADRHAVPIGTGDEIGERDHPATETFRQRLHGLGERFAAVESVDDRGESAAHLDRHRDGQFANRLDGTEPGVDREDEHLDRVGNRTIDAGGQAACGENGPDPTDGPPRREQRGDDERTADGERRGPDHPGEHDRTQAPTPGRPTAEPADRAGPEPSSRTRGAGRGGSVRSTAAAVVSTAPTTSAIGHAVTAGDRSCAASTPIRSH